MARHHFLTSRSRALRQNSTDAERKLWSVLRSRQLNGFKFRKQAEIDGYVVDFLCAEQRLIVEVDGGQHSPERDARRTAYLESQGFRLIRFWNTDVLQNLDGVWTMIEEALELHTPSPDPLKRATLSRGGERGTRCRSAPSSALRPLADRVIHRVDDHQSQVVPFRPEIDAVPLRGGGATR